MRNEVGKFILTGPHSVDKSAIMHRGTGRIARMQMYPKNLFESKKSKGKISLMVLFNNPDLDIDSIASDMTIKRLIFFGMWRRMASYYKITTNDARLRVDTDMLFRLQSGYFYG